MDVFLLEGFTYTLGHGIVKIRNTLAPVHLILIGLDRDAGKSRIGADGLGFMDMSMTGRKSMVEE